MADLFQAQAGPKRYETIIKPRPYQNEVIQATLNSLAVHRRVCTQLPTGAGKTVVFNEVTRRCVNKGYKVLVIAHREELIIQPREKLFQACGIVAGIIKSGYEPMPNMPVQIASIQTLTKRSKPKDIRVVIIDECFPAGTLVDGVPIELLQKGDFVKCFDHKENKVEMRKILRTFKSKPTQLLKLWLSDGTSIVCTPGHPFYVPALNEYVPAYKLLNQKIVTHAKDSAKDLLHLPSSIHSKKLEFNNEALLLSKMQGRCERREIQKGNIALHVLRGTSDLQRQECTCFGKDWKGLLLRDLQRGCNKEICIRNNVKDKFGSCVCENEGKKSNAQFGGKATYVTDIAEYELETESTGRQWQGRYTMGKDAVRGIELADKCYNPDRQTSKGRASHSLQAGHSEHSIKNINRSRWDESQFFENKGKGRQENSIFRGIRVESIEIHEQGSSDEFASMCPDGFVYNIEVEGNHNYFANDILVHNCHHSNANTYMQIQYEYPDAKIWGLTATPCRANGEGLEKSFDDLVCGVQVKFLEEQGYLVPAKPIINPLPPEYFANCRVTGGDYNERDLANIMDRDEMTQDLVDNYIQHAKGLRNCVFAVNVEHSQKIVAAYTRAGFPARHVDGTTPANERKAIFKQFERGEILILSNVGIATEGTDIPAIECVQAARPTKSLSLFLQMTGRGSRPAPGKTHYMLLDHANWIIEHGAPNAHRTWTLKGKKVNPKEQKVRQFKLIYPNGMERIVNTMTIPKDLKGVQLIEVTDEFRVNKFEQLYGMAQRKGFQKWWAFYKWISEIDSVPSLLELQYIGKKMECKPGWASLNKEKFDRMENFKDILTPKTVT
jgi:superfamily II DNA or RNA helicase